MNKPGSDFVDVQLSAAGIAVVGAEGALHIANGRMAYRFTPGSSTRVLSSEWSRVLSRESVDGQPLLEAAPASAPAPAQKTKTAAMPPVATSEDSSPSSTAKGSN